MKAYLLAAGEGRRLRPLTDTIPKCLVPVHGTPLLGIWLRLLEAHGITGVLVNLHHFHERVAEFLGAWTSATLTVHTVVEPQLLGSAGTVLSNRDFVRHDRDFLIIYADNLTNVDLGRMIAFHRARSETLTLAVSPTDKPREKGTVVISPAGQVLEFMEKAPVPRSNLANAGIYVADQRLFGYMPSAPPASGVLDFGFDVLPRMIPDVAAYTLDGFLMDIGTPAAYERAQETWPGL